MYTTAHFIWIGICIVLIIASLTIIKKQQWSLEKVLTACCIVSVASEVIKVFCAIQVVPSADGSTYYPYIETQHLPFHMCSLQILLIFFCRFTKNEKWRKTILGLIYPTALVGAFCAILVPTVFTNCIDVSQAFTHPWAYQFFLFHAMLTALGIYIGTSEEVDLQPEQRKSTIIILMILAFVSLYLNSMLGTAVYENGKLVSVEHITNFMFTYQFPIDLHLTTKGQWGLYLAALAAVALLAIYLFYIPICRRKKRNSNYKTEKM